MSQNTETRQNSKNRPTAEMLADLTGVIIRVLWKLSFKQVKYWLGKKTLLTQKLTQVFEIADDEFLLIREDWQKFYAEHFKLTADFSEVAIPTKPSDGSWRLIMIPAGLTMNQTLAVMRSKFKVWVYTEDLDGSVTTNTRTSKVSYAVWVRDRVEPDEKYLGKSTRDADMDGSIGMTLLERLIFEVKYFLETGEHLDLKGVTFCTGSRHSGGGVPCVDWDPGTGGVYVFWCSVDYSHASCGLRQAVS